MSKPQRKRPFGRFIPCLESLESRYVPAGNVRVAVSDGVLYMTGDTDANQIRVAGNGGSSVTITSLDGDTTINGQAGPVTLDGVNKGLEVVMGEGDDVLELANLSLRKNVTISMSAGNDTLTLDNVHVRHRVTITTKDGDDTVNILNSDIHKQFDLNLGAGDDTWNFVNSHIGRKSAISGGGGTDTFGALNNEWGEDTKLNGFESKTRGVVPHAADDTASVDQGGTVDIDVAANDSTPVGTLDHTSVTIVTQPTHGTATVNNDGTVTYVNDGSTATSDSFQYTIKNNKNGTSNVATVSITITNVNTPPVANNDTGIVAPGGTVQVNVAANDTDSDGTIDLTSIVITTQPTNGTVTVNNDGTVTYTHNGSATTSDTFQYTIKDNQGAVSNAATVTITVDNPPVANNDTATVTQGGNVQINVAANDTDSDGNLDLTSVTISQQPANGTVVVNNDGTVTYTHNGTATTNDTFTYTIKDNLGATSNVATVSITITPTNQPPVANNDAALVAPGGNVTINVIANDTDSDGTINPASVVIVGQPTNGTVVVNGDGTVTYTHTNLATTSDSFTYTVNDNSGATSNAATVSITVDNPPIANDDTGLVAPGGNVTINVIANDTDSDGTINPASVVIVGQPANGTVVVNGDGTVTYTHNGSATTSDSFTYTVNDNDGSTSNAATVSITVDNPPVANADTATVVQSGTIIIPVAANDTDSDGTIDPASIAIKQQPSFGTVTVNSDGTVTYHHLGSETAADSFTYTIKDNLGEESNVALVSITVTPVNQPPVANPDFFTVIAGSTTHLNVLANDTDPDNAIDPLTVAIIQQPIHGTVQANKDGTVTYIHDGSATTMDTFSYTVMDVLGAVSNVALVTITINP